MRQKKLLITLSILTGFSAANAAPLRDVPSGHWASTAVKQMVNDYGFMQGSPNGYFGGNKALTRYEFAKTMSRMVEYYNAEIDSDRKDIENMVSIMELFQNELKVLENKLNTVSNEVQEQNKIIGEINELTVAIGEEYQSDNPSEVDEMLNAKITNLEYNVGKLQNKGLFIDTLVKGTYNDIKKLGKATARVVSGRRKNVKGTDQYEESNEQATSMLEELESYDSEVDQEIQAIEQEMAELRNTLEAVNTTTTTTAETNTYATVESSSSDGMYNPYDIEVMEDIGGQ